MAQMIEANWLIFVVALVFAVLLAWWLFGRAGKPKVRDRRPDVLDEGAAPAQRNQALIDTPPAAAFMPPPIIPQADIARAAKPEPVAPVAPPVVTPVPAAGTFAGIGEVVAQGAQAEVENAQVQDEKALNAAAPADVGAPDDLRRIKGVGPKLVTALHALGVTRYAQIAAWNDADLDDLDTKLGAFAGRPRRDSWIEQARLLASGDTGAYEEKFGKL